MTAAAGAAPIPLSAAQPCTQKKDRAFVSKRKKTRTLTLLSCCKRKWKKVRCHIHHMLGAKEEEEEEIGGRDGRAGGRAANIRKRESRIV